MRILLPHPCAPLKSRASNRKHRMRFYLAGSCEVKGRRLLKIARVQTVHVIPRDGALTSLRLALIWLESSSRVIVIPDECSASATHLSGSDVEEELCIARIAFLLRLRCAGIGRCLEE